MGYLDNLKKQRALLEQVDPDYRPRKEQQKVIDYVEDLRDRTTRLRDEDYY